MLASEIQITLPDGTSKALSFDIESLQIAHELLGENPLSGDFWKDITPKKMRALILAGLHDKSEETTELVGKIHIRDAYGVFAQINKVFAAPDEDANPTSSSGPSAVTT